MGATRPVPRRPERASALVERVAVLHRAAVEALVDQLSPEEVGLIERAVERAEAMADPGDAMMMVQAASSAIYVARSMTDPRKRSRVRRSLLRAVESF